jgi:hypothetical protein
MTLTRAAAERRRALSLPDGRSSIAGTEYAIVPSSTFFRGRADIAARIC